MKLREYLIKNRMTKEQFAEKCGLGVNSIYRYIRRDVPSDSNIQTIVDATEGQVTVEDLLGAHDEKSRSTTTRNI